MPQYLLANYLPDNFDPSTMTEAAVQKAREIPYSSLPGGTPHPSRVKP